MTEEQDIKSRTQCEDSSPCPLWKVVLLSLFSASVPAVCAFVFYCVVIWLVAYTTFVNEELMIERCRSAAGLTGLARNTGAWMLFTLIIAPVAVLVGSVVAQYLSTTRLLRPLQSWRRWRASRSARLPLRREMAAQGEVLGCFLGTAPGGQGVGAFTAALLPLFPLVSVAAWGWVRAIMYLLQDRYFYLPFVAYIFPDMSTTEMDLVFAVCLLSRLFLPASPVLIGSSLAYAVLLPLLMRLFMPLLYGSGSLGTEYMICWRVLSLYLFFLFAVDLVKVLVFEPEILIVTTSQRVLIAYRYAFVLPWKVKFRFDRPSVLPQNKLLETTLFVEQEGIGRVAVAVGDHALPEKMLRHPAVRRRYAPTQTSQGLRRVLSLLPLSCFVSIALYVSQFFGYFIAYAFGLGVPVMEPYGQFVATGRPEPVIEGCETYLSLFPESRVAWAIRGDAELALDHFAEAAQCLNKVTGSHASPGTKTANYANVLRPALVHQWRSLEDWRDAYTTSSGVSPEAFRHYFAAKKIAEGFDPFHRRVIDVRRAYRHARAACDLSPTWREARSLESELHGDLQSLIQKLSPWMREGDSGMLLP